MLIEIPACHPSQERFLSETRRFNCLVAGRRWGKNIVSLHRLAPLAHESAGRVLQSVLQAAGGVMARLQGLAWPRHHPML
jgi:hypothetical protein